MENKRVEIDLPDINDLSSSSQIEIFEEISSHRKILGKLIILSKKAIRKLIIWFIEPIVYKQNNFNNKATNFIEKVLKNEECLNHTLVNTSVKLEENSLTLEEIKEKVTRLEVLNIKIDEYNFKLDKLKELDKKVSKIEGIFPKELSSSDGFFNKKSYSQSGEDVIIAYIFKYLAIDISKIRYLDLGANHAKELSNTNYFYENGAQGVLVEANPLLIPELHFYRHNDIILNKLVSASENEVMDFYILSGDGLSTPDREQAEETCKINENVSIEKVVKVTSITISDIFEKYFGGGTPDFISIDVEGYDLEILKSIDLDKYRPLVIVAETIEYRPYLPINVKVDEVERYLKTKDYVEYAFTGINSIFIDARRMKELNQDK